MARAGLATLLFLGSVAVWLLFARQAINEWIGNVRPSRAYDCQEPRCWRCRRPMEAFAERCSRCRAYNDRASISAIGYTRRYAVGAGLDYGKYLHHTIAASPIQRIEFNSPLNIAIRPGDDVDVVCDQHGLLRTVENRTIGTGWRIPTRVWGSRSPAAAVGYPILAYGTFGLLLLAPAFFLVLSAEHAEGFLRLITGTNEPTTEDSPAGGFAAGGAYMILLLLAGVLLTQLRSRPRLNRRIQLDQVREGSG